MYPKALRGSTPLRPITSIIRDTDACEASPEAAVAANAAATKNSWNTWPPVIMPISGSGSSTMVNCELSGKSSCAK